MKVPTEVFSEACDYGNLLVAAGWARDEMIVCSALLAEAGPDEGRHGHAREFLREMLGKLDALAAAGREFPGLHLYLIERLADAKAPVN